MVDVHAMLAARARSRWWRQQGRVLPPLRQWKH